MKRASSEQGLTLLEIVVSLFILGIASIGLFALASRTTTGNALSRERATATALAIDKIENLTSKGFDDPLLVAGTTSDSVTAGGEASGSYARSWTITNGTANAHDVKQIVVVVTAPDDQQVALTTEMTKILSKGAGQPWTFVKAWDQVK